MSTVGVGIDIQSISAFGRAQALREPGVFFTDHEWGRSARGGNAVESLAGILSAKEALYKALPVRVPFHWTDIEVRREPGAAPHFHVQGRLARWLDRNGWRALLSISHSGDYATAIAVVVHDVPA